MSMSPLVMLSYFLLVVVFIICMFFDCACGFVCIVVLDTLYLCLQATQ